MNYKNVVEEAVSDDDTGLPRRNNENVFENIDEEELKDTIGELDLDKKKKKGFFGSVLSKAKGASKLISRGSVSDSNKSLF